jgi:hypothetical protein
MRWLALTRIAAAMSLLPGAMACAAAGSEDKAVLDTVQLVLDGWREADAARLEKALHKDFREVTLHLQDGVWNSAVVDRATLIGLMGRIHKGSWDDRLLAPKVLVDGPIAVVWSPYRFTVNYTEDGVDHHDAHCGIETFQLYRIGAAWKIMNFADTHSDECAKATGS